MQTVSAYILAYNEAAKIADAISSVLWADEIVVADSGSTDRTVEIAEKLGARVVQIQFCGFGDLRNKAVEECRFDWIFSLDSDERCTAEVRDEILSILSAEPMLDAAGSKARAGTRTSGNRSSFARAHCGTVMIRCTKATSS